MREYSEHGTDAIRFLLDVMSDADPGETYSWHHRTSAAQELIRRGWDTNYDKITPKMLQEYWRDQQSTRLSVGQKKHLAGFHTFLDEYDQYDDKDYEANGPRDEGSRRPPRGSSLQVPSRPRNRQSISGSHRHQQHPFPLDGGRPGWG